MVRMMYQEYKVCINGVPATLLSYVRRMCDVYMAYQGSQVELRTPSAPLYCLIHIPLTWHTQALVF